MRLNHHCSWLASSLAIVACASLAFLGDRTFAGELPAELSRWLAPQAWERDAPGPIVSLGESGQFDDMHIFAPTVAHVDDKYLMWYPGSQGSRTERVFRLGLATSADGKRFEKHPGNPVLQLNEGKRSILTPAVLRNLDGTTLRESGKLRLWFSSADLTKGGLHTLHEATSADGIQWSQPSPALLENCYCPTVLKVDDEYQMWFSDVSKRPWLLRRAVSQDGTRWIVDDRPVLQLSQAWEAEVLVYPTVLKIDEAYLMWYGSYNTAVRRQTTAIGFAVSTDGQHWHKHPQNPVFSPDPGRIWESNYVGSGCVMRLADGSFRYWYASRTKPPFEHLYFAINTAHWTGPAPANAEALALPPQKGAQGVLSPAQTNGQHMARNVEVLEVIDGENAIVRAWYLPTALPARERTDANDATFVDLWLQGVDTSELRPGAASTFTHTFQVTGNKSFSTTCGSRSLPLLEAVESGAKKN